MQPRGLEFGFAEPHGCRDFSDDGRRMRVKIQHYASKNRYHKIYDKTRLVT